MVKGLESEGGQTEFVSQMADRLINYLAVTSGKPDKQDSEV